MVNIPVYKDDRMNICAPWTTIPENSIEKMFTPLFEEDDEGGIVPHDGCFEIGEDSKTIVLIWNKHKDASGRPGVLTIKAGDGVFSNQNLAMSMLQGSIATVTPESGRFKQTAGPHKGKVILSPGRGEFYVAVFEAP